MQQFDDYSNVLIEERKERRIPKDYPSTSRFKAYKESGSFSTHDASRPGIACVALHALRDEVVLTGGFDHKGVLFDRNAGKVLMRLEEHKKKINTCCFVPQADGLYGMLGSSDNSASVWRLEEKPKLVYRTDCHRHSVTGLSVHPMGSYAVVGSKDGTWSFHNIEKGVCLKSF